MSKYGEGKDLPFHKFVWGQLTHRVAKPEADLKGLTALVTGATSGYAFPIDHSPPGSPRC
jgi:hypothetical protein